jgi:uncharacterized membrane protein (DUF2068 family)
VRRITITRMVALVLNIAILVYLIVRLRRRRTMSSRRSSSHFG